MIIAVVDNAGHLHVFNAATGKIVTGAISNGFEHQPVQPDHRMDIVIGLLEDLNERVIQMSQTQDTVAAEVAELKANMVDLHTGVSGIQSRLDAALAAAAGGSTDPTVLADLHGVNEDLKSIVAGLAPAASSSASLTETAAATDSLSASVAGAAAEPDAAPQPVVFEASNTAPNVPGGRNSSQLPNFDPSKPETP